MDVIIIMCAGILVSKIFFPIKWKRINELLQLICTLLLIFSMGVMLGNHHTGIPEHPVLPDPCGFLSYRGISAHKNISE